MENSKDKFIDVFKGIIPTTDIIEMKRMLEEIFKDKITKIEVSELQSSDVSIDGHRGYVEYTCYLKKDILVNANQESDVNKFFADAIVFHFTKEYGFDNLESLQNYEKKNGELQMFGKDKYDSSCFELATVLKEKGSKLHTAFGLDNDFIYGGDYHEFKDTLIEMANSL